MHFIFEVHVKPGYTVEQYGELEVAADALYGAQLIRQFR